MLEIAGLGPRAQSQRKLTLILRAEFVSRNLVAGKDELHIEIDLAARVKAGQRPQRAMRARAGQEVAVAGERERPDANARLRGMVPDLVAGHSAQSQPARGILLIDELALGIGGEIIPRARKLVNLHRYSQILPQQMFEGH